MLDGRVMPGRLLFAQDIQDITPDPDAPAEVLILPGFVDTHVHGGGGGDAMDGPEGVRTLARLHARHGTTTLLPTTMTNPWQNVLHALKGVQEVMRDGLDGGADIVGVHLEGPFISPGRLGAQPPCTLEPTPEQVAELLAFDVIKAVTIAPEIGGALEAARSLAQAGVRIGVGHTKADAETVTAFLSAIHSLGGRTAGTHLFNAMGGIEGRVPGVPGAILADEHVYPEVILDNIHVHPTSFRFAHAAAPGRVMLITDAMRAAGQGDGESELGGQKVIVKNGEARLESGSLAGSVLTMDVALKNAVAAGIPLPEASRMASLTPAQSLGLRDRGELRPGLRADVVVMDQRLNVKAVYVGGREVSSGDKQW